MKKNLVWIILALVAIIGGVYWYQQKEKNTDNNVIKIGAILPLTGNLSILGEPKKKAFDLAMEELNGQDDIHFQIITSDSKGNPKDGIAAFKKLLNNKDINFYYIDLTPVVNAAIPIIDKNNVIVFAGSAEPEIANRSNNLFRLFAGGNQEIEMIVDYLNRAKIKNVFVLHTNELYGTSSFNYFKKEINAFKNINIVGLEEYPMSEGDFKSILSKIKNSKPERIILFGYGNEYESLLKQAKEFGIPPDKFVCNIGGSNKSVLELAPTYTDGITTIAPTFSYLMLNDKLNPEMLQFVEKYKEKYQETPDYRAAYTYDVIKILLDVWKKNKNNITKESTYESLLKVKNFRGASGKITILENGEATTDLILTKYSNGKLIPINHE